MKRTSAVSTRDTRRPLAGVPRTLARALAIAVVAVTPVAAQRTGPDGPGAGRGRGGGQGMGVEAIIEAALARRDSLALSPEQVDALEALREEARGVEAAMRERMAALRAEPPADRAAARESMEGFRQEAGEARRLQRERLGEILSREQRERLRASMGAGPGGRSGLRRSEGRGRGPGALRGPGARPGRGASGFVPARRAAARAYRRGVVDGLRIAARAGDRRGRFRDGRAR